MKNKNAFGARGGYFSRARSLKGYAAIAAIAIILGSCAANRDIDTAQSESIDATQTTASEITSEQTTVESATEAVEATETEAPLTEAPLTQTPVTEAPVTEAPVTQAPVTEAPVTQAPVTEAPVTQAPAPVTEAPVTEAPKPISTTVGTSSRGFRIENVNGVTYVGGVIIANKSYSLPSWYDPGTLTADTWNAFTKMQNAASADGLFLSVCSGYRSYATQSWLYQSYVNRDGQALADTYSARPGYSEHQTGLALDVNNTFASFAYSAEGKWLAEHCHEYGFIIRYPEGKQGITGYIYEPWHIRYVGTYIADVLHRSGETLEEYLGIDSQYK